MFSSNGLDTPGGVPSPAQENRHKNAAAQTRNSADNRRIAKNAAALYLRMFVTMGVALYASRIVLQTLGETDYGIYSVVGGVVAMVGFLNGAMGSATQRYLNVGIARGDAARLKEIFRTAAQVHMAIALLVLVFSETAGLWFVTSKLVIPAERMDAALWVFQFATASAMMGIASLPFGAAIIAHERMGVFAYISMGDAALKLGIVFLLAVAPIDKLVFYAAALCLAQALNVVVNVAYCRRCFPEVGFSFRADWPLLREMSAFACWSLWGNVAGVMFTQGVNILLNLFFGPAVNAARGVAVQVQGAINGFVVNVQTALNPQITKSYAVGDLRRMHALMFASSKFCFSLLLILLLPLALEADFVLGLWLGVVPAHTSAFVRLLAFVMLVETLANPYIIANQATGRVRLYQGVCGGLLLCIVPLSWLVLRLGGAPESVYIVHCAVAVATQLLRVTIMRRLIDLPLAKYLRRVALPVCSTFAASAVAPALVRGFMSEGALRLFAVCAVGAASVSLSSYALGANAFERAMMKDAARAAWEKICRRTHHQDAAQ